MPHRAQGQRAVRSPKDTWPEITEVTHLVRSVPPPAPSRRRALLGSGPPPLRPPPLPALRAAATLASAPPPPSSAFLPALVPPPPSSAAPLSPDDEHEAFALSLRRRRWPFASPRRAGAMRPPGALAAAWVARAGEEPRAARLGAAPVAGIRWLLDNLRTRCAQASRRNVVTHGIVAAVAVLFGWALGAEPWASNAPPAGPAVVVTPSERRISLEPTVLTAEPNDATRGAAPQAPSTTARAGSTAGEAKRATRGSQGKSKAAASARNWRRAQRANATRVAADSAR